MKRKIALSFVYKELLVCAFNYYLEILFILLPVDSVANPCQGYKTLSDSSRSARSLAGSTTNDNNIYGWYRFMGDAGDKMAEYELNWNSGVYRCASLAHGWLNGKHPSPSERKVHRTVCFTYNGNNCWRKTKIKVRNCGNFYVYLLNGFSHDLYGTYFRYCGVKETGEFLYVEHFISIQSRQSQFLLWHAHVLSLRMLPSFMLVLGR